VQNEKLELDRFDRAILSVLAQDGRISITDLASRIGLSKSPTQARLRRLEGEGALADFNAAVAQIPEIEQVHLIAGSFDYLMKVRTGSMASYRHVLAEKISTLPHLASTSTYVAMQAVKEVGMGQTP